MSNKDNELRLTVCLLFQYIHHSGMRRPQFETVKIGNTTSCRLTFRLFGLSPLNLYGGLGGYGAA